MPSTISQWVTLLGITPETVTVLQDLAPVIEPHMEAIMHRLYEHILAQDGGEKLFKSRESMERAQRQQQQHWLRYVFSGRFDEEYAQMAERVGHTHFCHGIDLKAFLGAYNVVQQELIEIVFAAFPGDPERQKAAVIALAKAVTLDRGLTTSVYYQSVVADLERMAHELTLSLARAGEFRDNETGHHVMRMSQMCEALALAAGQDAAWARTLRMASPLHDLGKIGIPDVILLKPGRLTPDELAIMREHPRIGSEIVPDHPAAVIRMARRVALTHHERWDGTGYPAGLTGEEIPLEGRIAAVCDVYDALVSHRPYKRRWSQEEAIGYLIDNRGAHFDPALVDAFMGILPVITRIQEDLADDEAQDGVGAAQA